MLYSQLIGKRASQLRLHEKLHRGAERGGKGLRISTFYATQTHKIRYVQVPTGQDGRATTVEH